MRTGMSTACFFKRLLVEETVETMKNMGVRHAEVFLNTWSEYSIEYNKDLRSRLDDAGIEVGSVHPHGVQFEPQLFSPYPRSYPDNIKTFAGVCEAASILGAKTYVFHGGVFFKPARNFKVDFARVAERLEGILDVAADYGIKLAYENVHWCWYSYPEFAKELLEVIDHSNLYFNLDVKQAAQSGRTPYDYMKYMGDRIANVHICDYVTNGKYVSPRMPFEGEMDFAKLRDELKNIGYKGNVILEVYGDNYKDFAQLEDNFRRVKALMEN